MIRYLHEKINPFTFVGGTELLCQIIEQPGCKAEKGPTAYAEHDASDGIAAEQGRKQMVCLHDIVC